MSEPKLVQTGDLLTISTDAPVTVPLFAIKTRKELCDWMWYLGTQPGITADLLLGFMERVHEYKGWPLGSRRYAFLICSASASRLTPRIS